MNSHFQMKRVQIVNVGRPLARSPAPTRDRVLCGGRTARQGRSYVHLNLIQRHKAQRLQRVAHGLERRAYQEGAECLHSLIGLAHDR